MNAGYLSLDHLKALIGRPISAIPPLQMPRVVRV